MARTTISRAEAQDLGLSILNGTKVSIDDDRLAELRAAREARKHTPAPWRPEIYEPKAAIIIAWDSVCAMRNNGDYTHDEFEANARLIAAAPALLEAAQELLVVEHASNFRPTPQFIALARAVAIATGML